MLSKRVQSLKPSPTLALGTRARELETSGRDVISLSLGEPDWDAYDQIKEAGVKAIHSGKVKYSPAFGIPALRKAIADYTSRDINGEVRPEQVAVSPGGKFVIFSLIQALVDPGDEVILAQPYWVSYPTMVELADGQSVFVDCKKNPGMKLLAADLAKAITLKTKLIILNSPSNPTGAVHTKEELLAIAEVLRKNPRVMLMSDDIYNRLVFSDYVAPHILHVAPDLKDRVVIVNGVSKTFSMTGWRLGWCVGPEILIKATANYMSQSVSCSSYVSQMAAVEALTNATALVPATIQDLKHRCEMACEILGSIPEIKFERPQGAFYIWVDVTKVLGRSWNGKPLRDTREWCEALLLDQGVAVVPGIEFGIDGYIRLSFVLDSSRMKEAFRRIEKFIQTLT